MPASPVAFVYKSIGNPTPRNCYRKQLVTMARTADQLRHPVIIVARQGTPAKALPLRSETPYQLIEWEHAAPLASALAQLRPIHQTTPICRIFSPQEEGTVELAAACRDALGIKGIGLTEARRFRNKDLMKDHVSGWPAEYALTIAKYDLAKSATQAVEIGDRIGWPVIAKPKALAGGAGVQPIESARVMEQYWAETVGRDGVRMVEELISDGIEYHVDTLVRGGHILFSQISRYIHPPIEFDRNPTGSVTRRHNLTPGETAIKQANERMVRGFNVDTGILHAEFWDRGGQAVFNEVGFRIGGAFIDRMTELSAGLSLPEAWVRMELDPNYTLPSVNHAGREAGALLLPAYEDGTITAMAKPSDLYIDRSIVDVSYWYDVGNHLPVATRSTRMSGVIYAQGESSDELAELLKAARKHFWYLTNKSPLLAIPVSLRRSPSVVS